MRLAVRLLGLDLLDITITTDDDQPDTDADLSGGTTFSTAMGFTPNVETPAEDPGE